MLKRIAPYLSVASAALVFLSWAVSNGLEDRARGARERTAGVIEAQREFARYWALSRKLSRLELAARRFQEVTPRKEPRRPTEAFSRLLYTDLDELERMRLALMKLSSEVHASPTATQMLELAERQMKDLKQSAEVWFRDHENRLGELFSAPLRDEDADAMMTELLRAEDEKIDELARVAEAYQMASVLLIQEAEAYAAGQARLSRLGRTLAGIAFVAGTLLALYGKMVEVRGRRNEGARDQCTDANDS